MGNNGCKKGVICYILQPIDLTINPEELKDKNTDRNHPQLSVIKIFKVIKPEKKRNNCNKNQR